MFGVMGDERGKPVSTVFLSLDVSHGSKVLIAQGIRINTNIDRINKKSKLNVFIISIIDPFIHPYPWDVFIIVHFL